jgi:hypothetical protein
VVTGHEDEADWCESIRCQLMYCVGRFRMYLCRTGTNPGPDDITSSDALPAPLKFSKKPEFFDFRFDWEVRTLPGRLENCSLVLNRVTAVCKLRRNTPLTSLPVGECRVQVPRRDTLRRCRAPTPEGCWVPTADYELGRRVYLMR